MVGHGLSFLLLSMAAGYLVLERAASQKKNLRQVGRAIGWVVILASVAAIVLKAAACGGGGMGKTCPFTGRSSMPAANTSAQ